MATVLTLGEMVDLALGSPEVGCVNYNALHTLLHGILVKLQISDAPLQLSQMVTDNNEFQPPPRPEAEEWGSWVGSTPSIATSVIDVGKKEGAGGVVEKEHAGGKPEVEKGAGGGKDKAVKAADSDKGSGGKEKGGGKEKPTSGGADKGGAGKSTPAEKGKRESVKATVVEASRGRKSSTGKGVRVGSPGSPDNTPLMVQSMPFHELAKRVERLEDSWKDLNEMQTIDPFKKTPDEKGAPLHDMWETLQFQKRLDANTEGVDKLMALTQQILHRLQKLAESDAEQMALITGSNQRIESLAPKADFDAVKQTLTSIAGKVDSLHEKDGGLVSWDDLETALTGADAVRAKGQEGEDGSHEFVEREGSFKDVEESELALFQKDDDESGEGGAGKTDGKGGKDKHGGKEGGKEGGREGGKEKGSGKEGGKGQSGGGKAGGKESGKRDGGGLTDSGGQLAGKGGSWDDTESRRGSGGKLGPSADLQTVLGALGKLDDKYKDLVAKVSGLENNTMQKDIFKLSADTMKRMSDSAITIESAREHLRDFSDELSHSYLEPLKNATEIIATIKDTAECSLPEQTKDEEQKLTGRRALAIGALEKSMKLVDTTFGVLQRAVLNLSCKIASQPTMKFDERMTGSPDGILRPGTDSRNLISSASMEDEVCKDEEAATQSDADSETKLKELEKKLGLRKDEMCKMTKRLNQLNKAVSQQLHDAKGRLSDLESRLGDMTCDLKRLIQKIESTDKGEYVVPTAAVLDGSGVSLLIGVQKALDDLREDMEKLGGKTDTLQLSNSKHQNSIEDLLKYASDLEEKKTDKADLIEKAAKQDLDLKLDSRVFEATCDEITKNLNGLLGRVARLDEECKNSFDKLTGDLGGCMTADEFDRIRNCMAKQFKILAKKLAKMQKQLEIAKLVGDDAAGIRRQLFKCLSCDRTILMASQDPKPALPNRDGLFPYRSTKPYTTYELEQIRQHARCFQIPKGLSNYERAVIERQLSRFKIRDLRGNANTYWKQDHPSSPIKHIRTAAVSPNSQGDPAVPDDPFPDPYSCTRPCGGSHTLTSPYKRVIHMADLSTVMTNDDQNQESYQITMCSAMRSARSPVSRSPVSSTAEVTTEEQHQTTISTNQVSFTSSLDKGNVESQSRSGMEHVGESESSPHPPLTAVPANSVLKQLSDDTGRRFSDPSVAKKPDVKKANGKSNGSDDHRRTSTPNSSSSAGATPSSASQQKKRRYSTPVTMSTKEPSSQSTHLRKFAKDQKVKEEDDFKVTEKEETANYTEKDNNDQSST